jgi:hypothetical protein
MATNAPTATKKAIPRQTSRVRSDGKHEGFLAHSRYLWLKMAIVISIVTTVTYVMIDVQPRHNGGSWYGYTLGTIGVLIILWLTMLGIRKRAMTRGHWSLKAWTSAHVYLGLTLIVIGTLHTGFQFDLNVHTLAYVLMMIVIISGIWGVLAYSFVPRAMSANREEMTENEMVASLQSANRQLHDAAQPLSQRPAELVRKALEQSPFGGGLFQRLSGSDARCLTKRARIEISRETAFKPDLGDDPLEKVDALLKRKEALLFKVRKHLRLKAWLEVWLYLHVPLTFALIAALTAHVISVFFYW